MRLLTFILCVTATLTNSNLALSGHVNKRSDDRDPLETVVMKLSADLNQMKTQQSVDMNQLHTELAELKGKVGKLMVIVTASLHVCVFSNVIYPAIEHSDKAQ